MKYEAIIGMEVHIELQTSSKMFCRCSAAAFGSAPNTNVCPVCLSLPGSLPVINRDAVEYTIMVGLALNCKIAEHAVFARKNYFYPDLPKGYQISQYELPFCLDGWLVVEVDGGRKRIGITRAHLEEDTGKLVHVDGHSLIDYNRAGVPLLEIVSEPDIRTVDEAYAYLSGLRQIVRYLGVSSGDMEKGMMRCEANVSIRPVGSEEFGTKVEVKNLNSFRSVRNAIDYEIKRQAELLEAGEKVFQVTMGWDEDRGVTRVQRSKEEAHDYRYFPEPDLPPLELDAAYVERIRRSLPELPEERRGRFTGEYRLSEYDAKLLTEERAVADYFERAVGAGGVEPKAVSNWITGEMFRAMNEAGVSIAEVEEKIAPGQLAALVGLVASGRINQPGAKRAFEEMWKGGGDPADIVERLGLAQISDTSELESVVARVVEEQTDAVQQYLLGKETVLKFLVGQVMRATRGKANPQVAEGLLKEHLSGQK